MREDGRGWTRARELGRAPPTAARPRATGTRAALPARELSALPPRRPLRVPPTPPPRLCPGLPRGAAGASPAGLTGPLHPRLPPGPSGRPCLGQTFRYRLRNALGNAAPTARGSCARLFRGTGPLVCSPRSSNAAGSTARPARRWQLSCEMHPNPVPREPVARGQLCAAVQRTLRSPAGHRHRTQLSAFAALLGTDANTRTTKKKPFLSQQTAV